MRLPLIRHLCVPLFVLTLTGLGAAQTWATVPEAVTAVHGNASVSLPLRWSWGMSQTIYDKSLFAGLQGQSIFQMRFRRPSFLGDPAQPASSAVLEVTMGESTRTVMGISGDRRTNTMVNPVVVVPQQTVNISATPAPAQGEAVGATLVDLIFAQPFVVPSNADILLQVRSVDTTFFITAGQWVDAVWMRGGVDLGLATAVGQRGCGGATNTPMRLDVALGDEHPGFGQRTTVELIGAVAGGPVTLMIGVNPLTMSTPTAFGAGLNFSPLFPNCQAWTPWDIPVDMGMATIGGDVSYALDFPAATTLQGIELGLQAFALELQQVSVAASSGVVLQVGALGIGPNIATSLYLRDEDLSPWAPFPGLAPVIEFGY